MKKGKKIAEVKRDKDGKFTLDAKTKKAIRDEAKALGLPDFDPEKIGIGNV